MAHLLLVETDGGELAGERGFLGHRSIFVPKRNVGSGQMNQTMAAPTTQCVADTVDAR